MAPTRPAPSARSYLLALPDPPMKTGATPTRLRPGVCRRAWSAQAAGAVATVVQFGHELAAAMCAPGVRGGGGRAGGAGAAGAVAPVVQFGHERAAAMCAPGVRVGMSMSAWERSVLLVAFSQGRELSRGKVSSCAGPCRRRFSA